MQFESGVSQSSLLQVSIYMNSRLTDTYTVGTRRYADLHLKITDQYRDQAAVRHSLWLTSSASSISAP